MASTDIAQQFGERHPFRITTAGDAVLDAMVKTWHDFGGSGLPYTVVAMPSELKEIATPAITYLTGLAQARGSRSTSPTPATSCSPVGDSRTAGAPST